MFQESSFGHARLKILDETRAHWSWYRNNDSDAVIADEVRLESLSTSKQCWGITDGQESSSSSSSSSVTKDEL